MNPLEDGSETHQALVQSVMQEGFIASLPKDRRETILELTLWRMRMATLRLKIALTKERIVEERLRLDCLREESKKLQTELPEI